MVVNRFVQLALGGIDPEFLEQCIHPEGSTLIGDDRDDPVTDLRVPRKASEQPCEGIGRRNLDRARATVELSKWAVIR